MGEHWPMTRATPFLLMLCVFLSALPAARAQQQGGWTAAGVLQSSREYGALVDLGAGKLLAVGGIDATGAPQASAEIYNAATGVWTLTGPMANARESFAVARLANGKVLVAGGAGVGGAAMASAEIFDPASGAWTATGPLPGAVYGHTATLLANGKVLAAGGCAVTPCVAPSSAAEIYDPVAGVWTPTGALVAGRYFQTAVRLANGKALVVGGLAAVGASASSELYDPLTGAWSAAANLNAARYRNATTLLRDGKVLVTGGASGRYPLGSAEIYDATANTWTPTGSMTTSRYGHSATLLGDGTVVVAGGVGRQVICGRFCTGYVPTSAAEIYNEATGGFIATSPLPLALANQKAVALLNGRAFLMGGSGTTAGCCVVLKNAEFYVPLTLTLTPPSLNFGLLQTGLTSPARTVAVANVSAHAVAFTGVATTGDYAQVNTCPATLAPGQTCDVSVTFAPTAASVRRGVLTLADDSPGSPRQSVPLSGVSVVQALAFTPALVNLGSVIPGSTSSTVVDLLNDGAAPVTLGVMVIAPAGVFSQTNNCPATLGVQQACTFNLFFAPPDVGTYTATLTVPNGAGAGVTLPMRGVGLAN